MRMGENWTRPQVAAPSMLPENVPFCFPLSNHSIPRTLKKPTNPNLAPTKTRRLLGTPSKNDPNTKSSKFGPQKMAQVPRGGGGGGSLWVPIRRPLARRLRQEGPPLRAPSSEGRDFGSEGWWGKGLTRGAPLFFWAGPLKRNLPAQFFFPPPPFFLRGSLERRRHAIQAHVSKGQRSFEPLAQSPGS